MAYEPSNFPFHLASVAQTPRFIERAPAARGRYVIKESLVPDFDRATNYSSARHALESSMYPAGGS